MSRLMLHAGAPFVPTGYGQQCAQLSTRLRDAGHDTAVSVTWGLNGSALDWEGIKLYPSDDQWGNLRLADYARLHQADLVITLLDVWVLKDPRLRELNLAAWVPVDHEPCPPHVAAFFKQFGARPIAMSRFGERMLADQGFDPLYVPHAVDTRIFRPVGDRSEARAMFGLHDDSFVVGMVANNAGHTPSRKAFPQAILAFSEFRRKHDDAVLYLHTEITGRRSLQEFGVDLRDLCERYGVPVESVKYTDNVSMDVGLPAGLMASLYASFDVLLNPSYGEGFGIPLIESQAVGTPVICTDWTAMPELCGAGWLVGGEPWDDVKHRSFYMAPNVGDILGALEQAYESRGDEALAERAVAFAQGYDADAVFAQYWVPALEALTAPREVGPLLPNREMRRRAAKTPKVVA